MTSHHHRPTVSFGADIAAADVIIVAVHGRDQGPDHLIEHIIEPIVESLGSTAMRVGALLPQGSEQRWYPERYNAPIADNQPWLDDALSVLAGLATGDLALVDPERVVWVGFSQGACLVAEYLARWPRRWGGAAVLTGGRIGPDDHDLEIVGEFGAMPVYFGVGRNDEWVTVERVTATADAFRSAGALVSVDVFDDADHVIRPTEVSRVAALCHALLNQR